MGKESANTCPLYFRYALETGRSNGCFRGIMDFR